MTDSSERTVELRIDGKAYPIPSDLTHRELGLIKRLSGVRSGEVLEACRAGDTDVLVALAVIAKTRAGEDVDEDELFDKQAGTIDSQVVDASPPAPTTSVT